MSGLPQWRLRPRRQRPIPTPGGKAPPSSLLKPLAALMAPGKADLPLKGQASNHGAQADRLESFARPCLLAAHWLASEPSPREDLSRRDLAQWFRQGLVIGTDPSSPEYWGPTANHHQHTVEMACADTCPADRPLAALGAAVNERTEPDRAVVWVRPRGGFAPQQSHVLLRPAPGVSGAGRIWPSRRSAGFPLPAGCARRHGAGRGMVPGWDE